MEVYEETNTFYSFRRWSDISFEFVEVECYADSFKEAVEFVKDFFPDACDGAIIPIRIVKQKSITYTTFDKTFDVVIG